MESSPSIAAGYSSACPTNVGIKQDHALPGFQKLSSLVKIKENVSFILSYRDDWYSHETYGTLFS